MFSRTDFTADPRLANTLSHLVTELQEFYARVDAISGKLSYRVTIILQVPNVIFEMILADFLLKPVHIYLIFFGLIINK